MDSELDESMSQALSCLRPPVPSRDPFLRDFFRTFFCLRRTTLPTPDPSPAVVRLRHSCLDLSPCAHGRQSLLPLGRAAGPRGIVQADHTAFASTVSHLPSSKAA